jgi:hypothetical protein
MFAAGDFIYNSKNIHLAVSTEALKGGGGDSPPSTLVKKTL